MTRKWSPKGNRGTNVEVCSLEMKNPWLQLESSRDRERYVISRVGWSYLAASQEKRKKERASMVSTAFYGARGGVTGQNRIDHFHWMKCIISKLQRQEEFPH